MQRPALSAVRPRPSTLHRRRRRPPRQRLPLLRRRLAGTSLRCRRPSRCSPRPTARRSPGSGTRRPPPYPTPSPPAPESRGRRNCGLGAYLWLETWRARQEPSPRPNRSLDPQRLQSAAARPLGPAAKFAHHQNHYSCRCPRADL
ncbi:hypothetical protein MUK42_07397, partial [Musa troglodytarum]